MRNVQRFVGRYGFTLVLILLFLMLVSPFLLRAQGDAPVTPGVSSYAELRKSELFSQGFVGYDPLRQEFTIPTPYTLFLSMMTLFGVPWLLPVLLAFTFILLLYSLLSKFIRQKRVVIFSLAAVVLSPMLSVLGTSHTSILLCLVLVLLSHMLFEEHSILACVSLILALITSPALGLLATIYFLFKFIVKKRMADVVGIALCIAVSFFWFFLWSRSIPLSEAVLAPMMFSSILFELGNPDGISIFFILLAGYGTLSPRMKNKQQMMFVTGLLFVVTMFIRELMPVTAILISVFAGYGIFELLQKRWNLELLRQSLLILVACIGLFLLIVTVRERVDDQPTEEFSKSMLYLTNQHRFGRVLSAPEYAPMIEYFSERRVTLQKDAAHDIFYSRNTDQVYDFLEKTGTSHILITEGMLATIFTRSDEGLLFLLPNTERFVLVHQTENTKLWYYIPRN